MASNPMAAANIANWVPQVFSKAFISVTEAELCFAKCVWTEFQPELKKGDRINFPNFTQLTDNVINTSQDWTLNDAMQNTSQVIVNYWYECNVALSKKDRIQSYPDFLKASIKNAAYTLAKRIDTTCANLVASAGNSVGTDGEEVTKSTLQQAVEYLNMANVPRKDRFLIIDPETLTDLMNEDAFISETYYRKGLIEEGWLAAPILGCKTLVTTNLAALNSTYHNACMMQREAIGLAIESNPSPQIKEWDPRWSFVMAADALWGCALLRSDHIVRIKTRS